MDTHKTTTAAAVAAVMVAAAAMMTMIEKTSHSLSYIICSHKLVIQQNIKQNSKNVFFYYFAWKNAHVENK
jgi:hypothetical protein